MLQDRLSLLLAAKKNKKVHTISPASTVFQAVCMMNDFDIGAILVVDEGRIVGIFSERDVLVRVVGANLNAHLTPLSQVMTRKVKAVTATTTVGSAMGVMTETRFRHLPVLDGDRLVGMISSGDLTRWTIRHQQDQLERLLRTVKLIRV